MRRPERIPIVIDTFCNNFQALIDFLGPTTPEEVVENVNDNWHNIVAEWLEDPNIRFGQLLSNMGYIPPNIGVFWLEETEWLVNHGYLKYEDINYWGVNFDVNNERLDKTEYKLLRDVTDEHIKNIKSFMGEHYNFIYPRTKNYFDDRLLHYKPVVHIIEDDEEDD